MSSFRSRHALLTVAATLTAAGAVAVPAAAAATGGAPSFATQRTLSLGAGVTDPRSLVVDDLDTDGRPDLIAGSANGGTGAVSVLRGIGAGAFAAPLGSPFGLGTAGGVGAIAAGDVNGDGRPDILATIGSGTLDNDELVPLVGDGTGDLTASTPITIGDQLSGVALADLDGDGDGDALTSSTTATSADQLGAVEQTPSGLAATGTVGATGTTLATAVVAGDFDGDGTPDALVLSGSAGSGSAWIATTSNFPALTPMTPVAVGADPVAAAAVDVDEDGDLDAIVLDGTAGLLTVLRNDGAGNLTATGIIVPGLTAGTGIAAGDLNGDGHADVAITDGGGASVAVLTGDGAGDFGTPDWLPTGADPRSPVIADVNQDGLPDLATANSSGDTLSLLSNVSLAQPTGALGGSFDPQDVGTTGAARSVTIANAGAAPLRVSNVSVAGPDADDFLITRDDCRGTTVASGADAACTVRVRFAPSAAGARAAVLRVTYGPGHLAYDVALSGTGEEADTAAPATTTTDATTGSAAATTTTTTTTTAAKPATTASVIPAPIATTTKAKTPAKLILTLAHTKLTLTRGARLNVGYALGRAAQLVLRVKRGGRTVDIVRVSGRNGRNTLRWDGKLGARPAPAGAYRLDVYAVAADGRAARKSIALTVKAGSES